jgi:uncharacterized protein YkwD
MRPELGIREATARMSLKTLSLVFLVVPALGLAQESPIGRAPEERGGGGVLVPAATIQPSKAPASRSLDVRTLLPLVGEPVNGFPNWQERVIHEWINRARVDPQADLAGCGTNCAENMGGCYTPQVPLIWDANAGRSARYHSAEMGIQSFFAHDSACTLVSNLNSIYPGSCSGSASCACVGGLEMCNPTCTAWNARIGLFGAGAYGEIIAAGYPDANSAFYGWLWEQASSTSCSFSSANGHRWLILKASSAVGTGYQSVSGSQWGLYYTGDFADSNSPIPKIPSGTHDPQQAGSIDFWANWYDSAPPQSAAVNVDGICYPMTLQRGSASNGAYAALGIAGLGSGCHRYFFTFHDSSGNEVTYPSSGSYGIGLTACNDWDLSRPLTCTSSAMGTRFYTIPPCRVLDTRNPAGPLGGPSMGAGGLRSFVAVGGACNVPAGTVAISANVAVVNPAGGGNLVVYPNGLSSPPTASTLTFSAGQTRANNTIVYLAPDGSFLVKSNAGGALDVVLDVNGYFK